jgi:Fe2+ or Zn2+ uptake regulation protein
VVEFHSEKLRALRDEICREHGFDPISHQFHIFGVSPQAKQGGKSESGK